MCLCIHVCIYTYINMYTYINIYKHTYWYLILSLPCPHSLSPAALTLHRPSAGRGLHLCYAVLDGPLRANSDLLMLAVTQVCGCGRVLGHVWEIWPTTNMGQITCERYAAGFPIYIYVYLCEYLFKYTQIYVWHLMHVRNVTHFMIAESPIHIMENKGTNIHTHTCI